MQIKITNQLLHWYNKNKRTLPFRKTKDPYKIWVSEVMLQQTQVSTVVPYFIRFVHEIPNLKILSRVNNKKLLNDYQTLIIVKSINIKYKKPAKLEDKLQIYSSIKSITKASFTMCQKIKKNEELVLEANIHLVTVNLEGKPIKIPEVLEENLNFN